MSHPAAETLELYVVGATPAGEIEAHLRVCESCTEEVRRQARLEVALSELAEDARFCPACERVLTASHCQACGAVAEVNGFVVERLIVQNARGRVYLARDEAGQAVALKELAFVQAPHPDAVDAFEREARLLRQLDHPQIPQFLASFHQGEGVATRLYLAQEYVGGESLLARLEHHQFVESEAVDVADQVLSILEHLQSLSPMVFHRDIKPANLIRRPGGRIALVDFGAARDLGTTVGATLVGTFGYMPVEQLGGIVDPTTDLYALGATLCHLLSRRDPWRLLEDPSALSRLNVSRGFRNFLERLMARRPADRYRSASAARAALKAARHGLRWSLPRPSPVLLTGMVAAASLGAFTFGVLLMPARRPMVLVETRSQESAIVRPVPIVTKIPSMPRPEIARAKPRVRMARFSSQLDVDRPHLVIDPNAEPYRVRLPPELTATGEEYWALIKICGSADGDVTEVKLLKSAHRAVDHQIVQKIKLWKYEPNPVPFCRSFRYVVGSGP